MRTDRFPVSAFCAALLASLSLAWFSDTATAQSRDLGGHVTAVVSVAFSLDGRRALTTSVAGTGRLVTLETGDATETPFDHEGRVTSAALGPDGTTAITGGTDGTLRHWDMAKGTELGRLPPQAYRITAVAISPDGTQALFGNNKGVAWLVDLASMTEVKSFDGHGDRLTAVAFTPDGDSVLTTSADTTARIWDKDSGTEVKRLASGGAAVLSVAISPDGTRAVTGDWDGGLYLWDLALGEIIHTIKVGDGAVRSISFGPDGKTILSGAWNGTARLWDSSTGALVQSFHGHEGPVEAVAFSPDGHHVLTGSRDTTVRLWSVDQDLWPNPPLTLMSLAPTPPPGPERRALSRPDTLILAIGNRTYAEAPAVEFAQNDAEAMARLLQTLLGVPEENVIVETNLTSVGMARTFGTEQVPEGRLQRRARFVNEVIVFYSGHGVPVFREEGLPSGYLLPVDVPAAEPQLGAYPLDLLVRKLEDLPVDRVTVLLDACFSGLSNQGSLVPGVSGAFGVAVAMPQEKARVSVLTATDFQTPQFAHWMPNKEHGAFSWFLLEGLQGAADSDADGRVHLSELRTFVDKSLAMQDLRQTPSLMPGSADSVLAEFVIE